VSRRDAEGAQEEPLVCTLPFICFTVNCATTVRRTKTATYQWSHLQLPNNGTSLLDYRTGRRDYYASLHRASGRCAANARTRDTSRQILSAKHLKQQWVRNQSLMLRSDVFAENIGTDFPHHTAVNQPCADEMNAGELWRTATD